MAGARRTANPSEAYNGVGRLDPPGARFNLSAGDDDGFGVHGRHAGLLKIERFPDTHPDGPDPDFRQAATA